MNGTSNESPVIFAVRGHLGHILLNRPRAINALNHVMVTAIADQLALWAADDSVHNVAITGSGDRGLCAGGDIVSLYRDATAGDGAASASFWRDEYALNALIARFPKPYVAFMDGVVLGGGIGISAHGSHRIVTERSKLGMPETGIGFIPDVGGTWLLANAPGELGTFLGLTAGFATGADAIAIGVADFFVPSDQLPALLVALETQPADAAIAAHAVTAPPSELLHWRSFIDAACGGQSVTAIVEKLQSSPVAAANAAAESILAKSPLALAVTLESLRRVSALSSLERVLEQEYRVTIHAFSSHDFAEGVRAQVIEKDRDPQWNPATLADVTTQQIEAFFAPLGENELVLTATP